MVAWIKAFPSYTNDKMYFLYPRISTQFMQNTHEEKEGNIKRNCLCNVCHFEFELLAELTLAHFIFSNKSSKFLLTGT